METIVPAENILDVWQLKSWAEQEEDGSEEPVYEGLPNHTEPPFLVDASVNAKICIWYEIII